MRIKPEIKIFIKETASKLFPEAELYLFGSRVNDRGRGGDIDILILSERRIDNKLLREFRIKFYKIFGWQKIDLVNLTRDDKSTFRKLIQTNIQPI